MSILRICRLSSFFNSILAVLLLSACGGGGGSGGGMGSVNVRLTDAPSCGYDHVYVTVDHVAISSDGNNWTTIPVSSNVSQPIDLLNLTNGVMLTLGEAPLPAGTYQQVRLVLKANNGSAPPFANSLVLTGSPTPIALDTPSAQQSGYKILGPITVQAGSAADLLGPILQSSATPGSSVDVVIVPPATSGQSTIVIQGVPVTAGNTTWISPSDGTAYFNATATTASAINTASDTVTVAGSLGTANLAANQTITSSARTYEIAATISDSSTGTYSLSLAALGPWLGAYSGAITTTPIPLTQDTATTDAGIYGIVASDSLTTSAPQSANVRAGPVTNLNFVLNQ